MLIRTVASENKRLKAENVMLKEILEVRSEQVHILAGKLLHHQTITEETSKQIEAQRSHTEQLGVLIHGLKMAVDDDCKMVSCC